MIAKILKYLGLSILAILVALIAALSFFGRSYDEQFEAKLSPTEHAPKQSSGKVEWVRYSDGEITLEVKVRNIMPPKYIEVDMRLNGNKIGSFPVQTIYTPYTLSTHRGDTFSKPKKGDLFEIGVGGQILLSGKFYLE